MGRLTEADAVEFLAIKALCYQGLDSIALRERSGERPARHLRAVSYCFGATDPATALPVHSVTVGLPPEAMHAFYRLVLATPSLDFGPWASRAQRVARLEDLVEEIDQDPYMVEILKPPSTCSNVQVALTASRSAGVPAWANVWENAMA